MPFASWSAPALAEEVTKLRHGAIRFARENGVREALLQDMQLVISEAVSNVVVHAFRDRETPGTIVLSVDVQRGRFVEVVVQDDGMGMSPRTDSPGLGLGLGLIARLSDEVEHGTPEDGNGFALRLRFTLDGAYGR